MHLVCLCVCQILLCTLIWLWRYQDEIDIYSSRLESDERGRGRERGRDRREKCRDSENGRSSRRQSAASLHSQVQPDNCTHVHNKIHVETTDHVTSSLCSIKSSDYQSGKHRSSKVKERATPERPQTQVSMVALLYCICLNHECLEEKWVIHTFILK